jgi:iron complex outermembrane receptor protein
MRGMGAFSLTQGVGFYLDDVQLISDPSARFGDLERVEVLKGPQGVLYGGNNIGGAVKFVTKRPSADAVSGSIKVMAGQQSSVDAEASINIPLNDDWAMRAFVYTREDDGFMYNITTKDDSIAGYEEEGGRIQIAGPLSENVSLYLAARINKWDGHNNNWVRESAQQHPVTFNIIMFRILIARLKAIKRQKDYIGRPFGKTTGSI